VRFLNSPAAVNDILERKQATDGNCWEGALS